MTINEIKKFLEDKPGYLKKSAEVLSGRLECDIELCETALYESRQKAKAVSYTHLRAHET